FVTTRSSTRKGEKGGEENAQAVDDVDSESDDSSPPIKRSKLRQNNFRRPIEIRQDSLIPLDEAVSTATSSMPSPNSSSPTPENGQNDSTNDLWHYRLGHPFVTVTNNIPNFHFHHVDQICEICAVSKSRKLPYPPSTHTSTKLLQLVHSDLCGPLPTSIGKNKYFITFTADYSRYTWVLCIPDKTEGRIAGVFQKWFTMAQIQIKQMEPAIRTEGAE